MNKPILFYDGGCPLCRKEIAHYRKLDKANRIQWDDIHQSSATLQQYGIEYSQAMQIIHAISEDGKQLQGVPAFICIWKKLPYYRHLASLVYCLRITPLLNRLYLCFAKRRYKRRCSENSCHISDKQ